MGGYRVWDSGAKGFTTADEGANLCADEGPNKEPDAPAAHSSATGDVRHVDPLEYVLGRLLPHRYSIALLPRKPKTIVCLRGGGRVENVPEASLPHEEPDKGPFRDVDLRGRGVLHEHVGTLGRVLGRMLPDRHLPHALPRRAEASVCLRSGGRVQDVPEADLHAQRQARGEPERASLAVARREAVV